MTASIALYFQPLDDGYQESLYYLTDIHKSINGHESREAMIAREKYKWVMKFIESMANSGLGQFLKYAQSQDIFIPVWSQMVFTESESTTNIIYCTTTYIDIAINDYVMIKSLNGTSYEIHQVSYTNADRIGITDILSTTWAAGSIVVPLREGTIKETTEKDLYKPDLIIHSIEAEEY